MKVALVSEWVDAWRGGAETSTRQFVYHLLDTGVELHLFTRSRPSPTPGLEVHSISGAALSRTRRSVTFAHRVVALLKEDDFDIVHAISPCLGADIYQPRGGTVAETIARNLALRRSPLARRLKGYANRLNLKQRFQLSLERQLLRDPQGPVVAALSDYVVSQLQEHYALPAVRIHKVFNGVDLPNTSAEQRAADRRLIRRDFHAGEDDVVVLLVAHNFRLKGVRCWMQAHARLLQQGCDWVRALVIGRGENTRWHRLAARLRLQRHLSFVGPSDRVPAFMHAADVLVHPTYYDPCSRVVLEGLATGLPCITTRWDGAAEKVEDGRSGFVLAEPEDIDALVEHVRTLQDPQRRRAMGDRGRRRADEWSMQRHAAEMVTLYRKLLTARSRRGPRPTPARVGRPAVAS
ncbi:MAG TPA: glycosyltransferase family 4 protein [Phycisphaerae bacterium]|nr:glycosyltransferase family 4 protein [Phycisphaerae bacterium]HNU44856.1 glycosyltransferase family 4 protein [Phycisphaerae bacterium]